MFSLRGRAVSMEGEPEVRLEPPMEITLQTGLRALPTPQPGTDFNARVLTLLDSERDFAPWWRQMGARVQWMLLPAALSFSVTFALALWQTYSQPKLRPAPPRPMVKIETPALPPLPNQLFPHRPDASENKPSHQ